MTCSKRSGVALNTRGLTTDTQNTKNLQLRKDPSGLVLFKATPAGINTAMRGDIQRKQATQEEKLAGQRGKSVRRSRRYKMQRREGSEDGNSTALWV